MAERPKLFIVAIYAITVYLLIPAMPLIAQSKLPLQQLNFSGFTWDIRRTAGPEGPLDNYFAGKNETVFLEADGALRMTVANKDGIWHASEVFLRKRLGYGTYLFRLETDMASLDRNLVLGLFTYSGSKSYAHREIDIEFSSWGYKNEAPKGQFVVQPADRAGNMVLFPLDKLEAKASYLFEWRSDRIEFAAWNGHGNRPVVGDPRLVMSWSFSDVAAIPKPGNEVVHLNLYLAKGGPAPFGIGTTSVVIRSFEFKALK